MTNHLSEKQVEDFAHNKLGGEDLRTVEEHLLICEPCQVRVLEFERHSEIVRHALADLLSRPGRE